MKLLAKLFSILAIAGAMSSCVADPEEPQWVLPIGSAMPDFEVTVISQDREPYTLNSQDLHGHTSIIVFFNTDCRDCQEELPKLQEYYDTLRAFEEEKTDETATNDDTILLLISREETEESIAAYWREHNLTLPYAPQPDRRIYNLFATTGIPRTFTFSPTGRLLTTTLPTE